MSLTSATIGYPSHIFIHSILYLDGPMVVFPFQLRIVQLPIRLLVFSRSLSRFDRLIEDTVYHPFVTGSELARESSAHSLSRGNRSNGCSHGHSSGHSTSKRSTSRACQGRSHNESPEYGSTFFQDTVQELRKFRAKAVMNYWQYIFVYLTIAEVVRYRQSVIDWMKYSIQFVKRGHLDGSTRHRLTQMWNELLADIPRQYNWSTVAHQLSIESIISPINKRLHSNLESDKTTN